MKGSPFTIEHMSVLLSVAGAWFSQGYGPFARPYLRKVEGADIFKSSGSKVAVPSRRENPLKCLILIATWRREDEADAVVDIHALIVGLIFSCICYPGRHRLLGSSVEDQSKGRTRWLCLSMLQTYRFVPPAATRREQASSCTVL